MTIYGRNLSISFNFGARALGLVPKCSRGYEVYDYVIAPSSECTVSARADLGLPILAPGAICSNDSAYALVSPGKEPHPRIILRMGLGLVARGRAQGKLSLSGRPHA